VISKINDSHVLIKKNETKLSILISFMPHVTFIMLAVFRRDHVHTNVLKYPLHKKLKRNISSQTDSIKV